MKYAIGIMAIIAILAIVNQYENDHPSTQSSEDIKAKIAKACEDNFPGNESQQMNCKLELTAGVLQRRMNDQKAQQSDQMAAARRQAGL